jgi:hypothetical protein
LRASDPLGLCFAVPPWTSWSACRLTWQCCRNCFDVVLPSGESIHLSTSPHFTWMHILCRTAGKGSKGKMAVAAEDPKQLRCNRLQPREVLAWHVQCDAVNCMLQGKVCLLENEKFGSLQKVNRSADTACHSVHTQCKSHGRTVEVCVNVPAVQSNRGRGVFTCRCR